MLARYENLLVGFPPAPITAAKFLVILGVGLNAIIFSDN